ncbi:MAG: hypothetical protein IKB42_05215 [Clostridia bacterium]|nr:hypothetical protein [Clostridia bacterium]
MLVELFYTLKLRYTMIFSYGSKNAGYIALKTLLLVLFTIPFFVYEIVSFVVEMILLLPSFIPIIGLPFKFVSYILSCIGSWFCTFLCLPDVIYDTPKTEAEATIERLNNMEEKDD